MTSSAKPKLKVALVISGAISLGSFESGIVTELIRASQDPDSPIVIDVVGGASAGAITAAGAALYLSQGCSSDGHRYIGFEQWCDIDLAALTRYHDGEDSLLSRRAIERSIEQGVLGGPRAFDPSLHKNDVLLFMTLTNLHGRPTHVLTPDDEDGVAVHVRYREHSESVFMRVPTAERPAEQWGEERVMKSAGPDDPDVPSHAQAHGPERLWVKIFKYALTSSANAMAWAPVPLHDFRNRPDIWWPHSEALEEERKARESRFGRGSLFFTDGGTVDNRPILKMLEFGIGLREAMYAQPDLDFTTLHDLDEVKYLGAPLDLNRMLLFIEPDPRLADSEEDGDEEEADQYAGWVAGALRAATVAQRASPNYTDLQIVGGANRQVVAVLRDVADFAAVLAAAHAEGSHPWEEAGLEQEEDQPEPPLRRAVEELFHRWVEPENAFAGAMLDKVSRTLPDGRVLEPLGPHAPLRTALQRLRTAYLALPAPGQALVKEEFARELKRHHLSGVRWTYVDRVAPQGTQQPAGRLMGHFGGFVRRQWLWHDYHLGRLTALKWLHDSFRHDVDQGVSPQWLERLERLKTGTEADLVELEHDLDESVEPLKLLLDEQAAAIGAMARQSLRILHDYLGTRRLAGVVLQSHGFARVWWRVLPGVAVCFGIAWLLTQSLEGWPGVLAFVMEGLAISLVAGLLYLVWLAWPYLRILLAKNQSDVKSGD